MRIAYRFAPWVAFGLVSGSVDVAFADATSATQSGTAPTDVAAGVTQQKDSGTVLAENKKADDSTAVAVNAGAQFVTGNSRLVAITGGGKIELRRGENGFGAALIGNYAEAYTAPVAPATNGTWTDTVRNLQGKLRYDRFFGPNFSIFLQATGTHDAFQATTFRLNIDPGVKYLFVNKDKTKFWGELGYDFEFDDNYTDSQGFEQAGAGGRVVDTVSGLPFVIIETNTMHSARAYLGFRHAFNKEVAISAGLEYLQGFGGSGDGLPNLPPGETDLTVERVKLDLVRSRLNFDALFTANLGHGLALGAGFTAKYNSAPLPGKENLDTTTTLTLIFTYATPAKKKEEGKPVCPTEPGPLVQPPAPQTPPYTKTLAGGYAVVSKPGGTESSVLSDIEDKKPAAELHPIELDGIGWNGDALDAAASKDQIKNLAEIVKAYPSVQITIVATQPRADALKAALEAAGADAKRVATEAHEGKPSIRVTAK
jgi:hypothetical protein